MNDSLFLILQLHTPEELVYFSNIAHWIEGILFILVAIFVSLEVFGVVKGKGKYIWPSTLLAAGLFLPLFSFTHHFAEMALAWKASIYDPQQRQHLFMTVLIALAGFTEINYLRTKAMAWRFVMPAVLGTIGILFLTHPQHGTGEAVARAVSIHQYLGTMLILSGVFRLIEIMSIKNPLWLRLTWALFLLSAAILLIIYREPAGAYEVMQIN